MHHLIRNHNYGLTPSGATSQRFPYQESPGYINPGGIVQSLLRPEDAVYDSTGNLFIANTGKNHILKIDTGLNITVLAGDPDGSQGSIDGTGTNAKFNTPTGICIDPSDNLFVCDLGNSRIRKVTPGGVVTSVAGGILGFIDGTGTSAGFLAATAIAYDPISTDLFVIDLQRIRRVTQAGVVTTFCGSPYGTLTDSGKEIISFNLPSPEGGVLLNTIDNRYYIYTLQPVENALTPGLFGYEISSSGIIKENLIIKEGGSGIFGVRPNICAISSYYEIATPKSEIFAFDARNRLGYFRDYGGSNSFFVIAGSGLGTLVDGQGGIASFKNPKGLIVNPGPTTSNIDDILYCTDENTVRKIIRFPVGDVSIIAGNPNQAGDSNGPGPIALFNNPTELCRNPATGDIYVCDTDNHKIKKIDSSNVVSTFIGTGTDGNIDAHRLSADISSPRWIVFHPNGNLYFWSGACLKQCDMTTGQITTVAGDFYVAGEDDGAGTNAKFIQPTKMIVNQDGDFLIYDSLLASFAVYRTIRYRIRKITISGFNVSTFAGGYPLEVVNGTNTTSKFGGPQGIAVDSTGKIFVADNSNGAIGHLRQLDSLGNSTTVVGGTFGIQDGVGAAAQLGVLKRMSIDANDNLYVAEQDSQIRKIDPSLAATTIAGDYNDPGLVNGPIATARFQDVNSVCVNPVNNDISVVQKGALYSSNSLLRLISGGNVTTVDTTQPGPTVVVPPLPGFSPGISTVVIGGLDGIDVESPSTKVCCHVAPAGETIATFDIVYLYQGKIFKLNTATAPIRPFLFGVARNSGNTGDNIYLQFQGTGLSDDDVSPFYGLAYPAGTLYYANGNGGFSTTPPGSGFQGILGVQGFYGLHLCPVFLGTAFEVFDITLSMENLGGQWIFTTSNPYTLSKPWIQVVGGIPERSGLLNWFDWTTYFDIQWDGAQISLLWKGDTVLNIGKNDRITVGKVYIADYTMVP